MSIVIAAECGKSVVAQPEPVIIISHGREQKALAAQEAA